MYPTESPGLDDEVAESAVDALGTLASEHRIAILRELAVADEPLAFSELRERFVRETEGKYELGHAGERVVLATADLDTNGAAALAEAHDTDENDECAVCGETDCNRVIHVHLSGT
ncbi:hypothetical protein SAMN05421858_1318 [Haladaptatus litoreus]|uniref:Uncharacterized protein n=1 Tax=Haladaptatus litoreus TaxID=553468 RepID=A0A1N6XXT9_9EURY|nr:hypothetical protein [Haladaptatus litoreus]SIR07170.1 hypothetical protein SAMN05421858_1318 [Haladaptatus litoreus]